MISNVPFLADNIADEVSILLNAMSSEGSWTKRKSELRDELIRLLEKKRYLTFKGSPYRYLAHCIGDSYLYDVPLYKQGLLKIFRGKRIRIVCVGSGRYKRHYKAGVVGVTPKELVLAKLVHNYEFPSYATDSYVLYKSRRYLVFRLKKSFKLPSEQQPKGFFGLSEWDSILIDGKDGLAKGKLRHNEDGTISFSLLGWNGSQTRNTLKEAVEYLKDSIA